MPKGHKPPITSYTQLSYATGFSLSTEASASFPIEPFNQQVNPLGIWVSFKKSASTKQQ